jgi:hypothetical protein
MAEEMISKERIDYTIDLLITMAVEEIAEDTGKSPKEILPEFYSSKTGKMSRPDYGAMAHPILPNYTWTNSPKERFEKKLFLTYYAFETAFLINRPPGTKAPSFLSILGVALTFDLC